MQADLSALLGEPAPGGSHGGGDYELVSEMLCDGLGQRRQVTAWEGRLAITTTCAVDTPGLTLTTV